MQLIIGTGAVNNTGGALAEGTAELHATHIVAVGCKTVAQYGHRLGACGASGSRLASLSLLEYSSDDDDEKDDENDSEREGFLQKPEAVLRTFLARHWRGGYASKCAASKGICTKTYEFHKKN